MKKACHITTVHDPFDVRIFHKECKSLACSGYDVVLIAPGSRRKGLPWIEHRGGVKIVRIGTAGSRLARMLCLSCRAYAAALAENADIYHFHDPEFMPWALKLKRKTGAEIIYDVHEDYITGIRQKEYIPGFARKILAGIYMFIECNYEKNFVKILAENYYRERFPGGHVVLNYPVSGKWAGRRKKLHLEGEHRVLYAGNVSADRGAFHHANIVNLLPRVHVYMVGRCDERIYGLLQGIASVSGRLHLECEGFVPFGRIQDYYSCDWLAGLAVFPATEHYFRKEPTKIFEYMDAGIPVIASNFPVLKNIIEGAGCGICVDPSEPAQLKESLEYLAENPEEAGRMGKNGRKAVLEKYNWEKESKKLLGLYGKLAGRRPIKERRESPG